MSSICKCIFCQCAPTSAPLTLSKTNFIPLRIRLWLDPPVAEREPNILLPFTFILFLMPTIIIPHYRNIAGIDLSCWRQMNNYDQHMQWTISVTSEMYLMVETIPAYPYAETGYSIYLIIDARLDKHMKICKVIISGADIC
eukprot:6197290-Pleurochrysis_carterae.AAC.2